jgi:hypothetical protein
MAIDAHAGERFPDSGGNQLLRASWRQKITRPARAPLDARALHTTTHVSSRA